MIYALHTHYLQQQPWKAKKKKKIIISRVAGTGPNAASAARSCCPRSDALWGLKTSSRHTSQTDRKQFKIMG